MTYIIFSFFILLGSLTQCFGEAVNIGVFSKQANSEIQFLKKVKEKFPDVNIEIINYETTGFESSVESLFKQSKKYDIFTYEIINSKYIAPYLLDLREQLPKEHIDIYNSNLISETGIYNNKLIGLPLDLSYGVFYSNKILLNKYNKPIPKTWDELIDTCKYIIDKDNDENLICYNGFFDESEQGLYSLYEFIYSCRDTYNSTYPEPQDQSFVNSLKMLNKIKEEVASDKIFFSNENYTFSKLIDGKSIFIKYWLVREPFINTIPYYYSITPGFKEGLSGSMMIGTNIGIAKDLSKEKKEEVLNMFKYITSKEFQKDFTMEYKAIPAITELWDDDEICKDVQCDLIKNIQVIQRPKYLKEGSEENNQNYRNYIYQYLYGNKAIEETVKQIKNSIYMTSGDTHRINMTLLALLFLLLMNTFSIMLLY